MSWIPLFAWLAAVVIALVVLGFCAYEIVWRTHRLQDDLQQLQGDGVGLAQLQDRVAAVKQRFAQAGQR